MESHIWNLLVYLLFMVPAHAENSTSDTNEFTEFRTEPAVTEVQTTLDFSTVDVSSVPPTCANFKELDVQQPLDPNAVLKKCCPIGEQFFSHSNGSRFCGSVKQNTFHIDVIFAKFYEGCIEDEEKNITLAIKVVDKCEKSVIYNQHNHDVLFIMQNGSLLSIDGSFTYFDVFKEYCVEMDEAEGVMTGFVCDFAEASMHVSRAEIVIMAVCMFASVVFLSATIFIYSSVKELRDLHGKSLICHSSSLLAGYILLVVVNLFDIESKRIGYFIQFAILSCFFWMLVMCIDIFLHTWFYLPRGTRVDTEIEYFHFAIYGSVAIIVPLLLVICTVANHIPGMPSYYLKASSSKFESVPSSQAFFIPPICFVLLVSVGLFIAIYVGFKHLQHMLDEAFIAKKKLKKDETLSELLPKFDNCHIEKVRIMARSTGILLSIMTVCWCLELITYFCGAGAITLLDVFNSLQGVFIFFVFVCLPRPRKLIQKWWTESGSIDLKELEGTEMITMNNGAV